MYYNSVFITQFRIELSESKDSKHTKIDKIHYKSVYTGVRFDPISWSTCHVFCKEKKIKNVKHYLYYFCRKKFAHSIKSVMQRTFWNKKLVICFYFERRVDLWDFCTICFSFVKIDLILWYFWCKLNYDMRKCYYYFFKAKFKIKIYLYASLSYFFPFLRIFLFFRGHLWCKVNKIWHFVIFIYLNY